MYSTVSPFAACIEYFNRPGEGIRRHFIQLVIYTSSPTVQKILSSHSNRNAKHFHTVSQCSMHFKMEQLNHSFFFIVNNIEVNC